MELPSAAQVMAPGSIAIPSRLIEPFVAPKPKSREMSF
jgi:hypothetical protein